VGRKLLVGLGSALAAGLLAGALSRLLMRLVALAAGDPGEFSWAGTAGILAVFVVAVLPGALLAAATTRRGRWVLLAAGAVLLCVPAVGVASEEVGDLTGFTAAQWTGLVLSGTGVFATIAALPFLTLRLVDRALGRARPRYRGLVTGRSSTTVS
jgi:uncharacterized protein (AIM24 family)